MYFFLMDRLVSRRFIDIHLSLLKKISSGKIFQPEEFDAAITRVSGSELSFFLIQINFEKFSFCFPVCLSVQSR